MGYGIPAHDGVGSGGGGKFFRRRRRRRRRRRPPPSAVGPPARASRPGAARPSLPPWGRPPEPPARIKKIKFLSYLYKIHSFFKSVFFKKTF